MTAPDPAAVLARYRQRHATTVRRAWEQSNGAGAVAFAVLMRKARRDLGTEEPATTPKR